MKIQKIAGLGIIAGVLLSVGYGVGEQNAPERTTEQFEKELLDAGVGLLANPNAERKAGTEKTATLHPDATQNPWWSKKIITSALNDNYSIPARNEGLADLLAFNAAQN